METVINRDVHEVQGAPEEGHLRDGELDSPAGEGLPGGRDARAGLKICWWKQVQASLTSSQPRPERDRSTPNAGFIGELKALNRSGLEARRCGCLLPASTTFWGPPSSHLFQYVRW